MYLVSRACKRLAADRAHSAWVPWLTCDNGYTKTWNYPQIEQSLCQKGGCRYLQWLCVLIKHGSWCAMFAYGAIIDLHRACQDDVTGFEVNAWVPYLGLARCMQRQRCCWYVNALVTVWRSASVSQTLGTNLNASGLIWINRDPFWQMSTGLDQWGTIYTWTNWDQFGPMLSNHNKLLPIW